MSIYTKIALRILGAVGMTAVLFFLMLYVLYRIAFRGLRSPSNPYRKLSDESHGGKGEHIRSLIDRISAADSERISITAEDGTTLCADLIRGEAGAPLEILCHGYRSNPYRDMSGVAAEAMRRGHSILMVHARAHGVSGGRAISFGSREARDIAAWAKATDKLLGGVPTVLFGVSMGAATVIMTSALPLPPSVRCAVADCPYSSAEQMLRQEIAKDRLPSSIFYPLVRLSARMFAGFDPEDASPIDAIRHSRLPLLLIHGDEDSFVPCRMSEQMREVCASECELLIVHGAAHAMSYVTDSETYARTVDNFYAMHLYTSATAPIAPNDDIEKTSRGEEER